MVDRFAAGYYAYVNLKDSGTIRGVVIDYGPDAECLIIQGAEVAMDDQHGNLAFKSADGKIIVYKSNVDYIVEARVGD